ncbi:MAG: hypothetical protein II237_07135 [Clostridia bacterium]|nr:hypothetical protein [Clostridia bacterium]
MNTDMEEFVKIINELTDVKGITMTEEEIEKYTLRFDSIPNNFKFTPGSFTKEDAVRVLKKKFLS